MVNLDRILIVGGGISGLSLATTLHQEGYTPEIIERDGSWPLDGTAIVTPANGVRALRELGVDINQKASVVRRWGFCDRNGELLCETDLEDLWKDVGPCLAISRARLLEALLKRAQSVPSRLCLSPISITQDRNLVQVSFSDGSTGEYDLVVGADGIYSTVRRLVMNSPEPTYAGNMGWRSIVPTRIPGIADNIMFLLGDGCVFGLIPVGDGSTYGFAGVSESRFEDPLAGRVDRLQRRFSMFSGPVPDYLAALKSDGQVHFAPIEWVQLEDWYKGRVVLVGDAAHAGPPHMAEGGCMAMEDAIVLSKVLRTSSSVEGALEAYVQRRRPRVEWVREQSRAAAKGWFLPSKERNATLRERGDQMFRHRYMPLLSPP